MTDHLTKNDPASPFLRPLKDPTNHHQNRPPATSNPNGTIRRFPVRSYNGFEYVLVVTHRGYIHLAPLKNRLSVSYVSVYKSVFSIFSSLFHPISHLILDNETSSDLTIYYLSISLVFRYATPQNHRALPVERSIRTAKKHVISVISSFHVTFPPNRWPDLLPQSELTLNTLCPWSVNPDLSAYHGLHCLPFDFSAHHPSHPPDQLVNAHGYRTKPILIVNAYTNVPVQIPALMSQLSHNSMHGNNVYLQVNRNDPYRQKKLSGMETPHMINTGNFLAENKSPIMNDPG
jgi:hypothetical protein